MCGRYTNLTPMRAYAELFGAPLPPDELPPRYNVAPGERVLVCRAAPAGGRELALATWGLVPVWSRDPSSGPRPINARAETVAQKPLFRGAFRRRRCLVAADGFYEWQPVGRGKQPWYLRLRGGRPFAFAGLWERWQGPEEELLETCAIVVTAANRLVAPIHDRMPVILPPGAFEAWLDPEGGAAETLLPLLRPFPEEEMEAYPVSTDVNRPGNEGPRLIEPVAAAEDTA